MNKIIEKYTIMELIGEGSYGKVYRALNNQNNYEYAIKIIPIKLFKEIPKLQECTMNQINVLSKLNNTDHIIKYIQMLRTQNNYYFVYQYCNEGTLQNILKKQQRLIQSRALSYLKQLIKAFEVLHKQNIMHRDLKPDNIFFHNGQLKLGDFGFCKNLKQSNSMTSTMLGSPIYMAPEILKGQQYTYKADIWSLGVVLFQMLFGFCPYESSSISKLISVLQDTELRIPLEINNISQKIQVILKRMLTIDEDQRISWNQLFTQISILDKPEVNKKQQQESNGFQSKSLCFSKNFNKKNSLDQKIKKFRPNNFDIKYDLHSSQEKINDKSKQSEKLHHHTSSKSINDSNSNKVNQNGYMLVKRKLVLQQHSFCTRAIKTAIQFIQMDEKDSLIYSYILIKKIYQKLGKIKLDLKINKVDFQDILLTLNKQIVQVQRMLYQIKNQLICRNVQMNILQDSRNYLYYKYKQHTKQINIKLWYQMVNFLFGNHYKYIKNPREVDIEYMLQKRSQKIN